MVISSSLFRCSVRRGCLSVWSERCRHVESESYGHGDHVGSEVYRCQGSDEGGQVWPAHQDVAGENLSEALVELVLMSLTRADGMSCWDPDWDRRCELTLSAASRSVASSNTVR